tara:strand:- start:273 stop:377 length:105 start_codon:yes stop_codon:yes gene_type:complete
VKIDDEKPGLRTPGGFGIQVFCFAVILSTGGDNG